MSEKRAKYVGGSLTGVDLSIPFKDGDVVQVHVPHGGELPAKTPDGRTIPAGYRDSLLEQEDNWKPVNRATGDDVKGDTAKAGKEGER